MLKIKVAGTTAPKSSAVPVMMWLLGDEDGVRSPLAAYIVSPELSVLSFWGSGFQVSSSSVGANPEKK